ncbi:serine/threonine-protein kinase [Thermomonospora amylolytica]|uniref:serine/threonine-protein kinase n=1 Tax=Thermomonospora amylolytica TaxID=1411117 RepID=UPI000E6D4671|nr:serine/threonine-protein kinase [Thermomonospora amylolytica]
MAQAQQGHLLGNRYRLDRVVGRGGMGTVWQAYDTMLDREVAVKEVLLPPGLSPDERDVLYERTFREARASARLNHPSVVTVHDVVNEGGRPWLVMEFVRARSLQDMIDEGLVPYARAAEIGRQTLEALRHAHGKGILHRDVKPSNVLITAEGRAVLTDFGIAQVEGDSTLTQTGLVMGSPAYIPPERAQGERAVPASDLWSLGATLYAAVEGRSPYERSDAMASLAAVLSEPVPPPRNAGPLTDVLMGLLAREPRYRLTADQALPKLAEVAEMGRRPRPPSRNQVREFPTVLDETQLDETKLDEPFERPNRASIGYGPPPPLPPEAADTVLDSAEIEVATREDSGSRPLSPSRPDPSDAESRTVLQPPDWNMPPRPPTPYTPPPWQSQQPRQPDRYERERAKTIVIVTVAVILVVIAVLAGALILRAQTGALGPAGPGGQVTASRV